MSGRQGAEHPRVSQEQFLHKILVKKEERRKKRYSLKIFKEKK